MRVIGREQARGTARTPCRHASVVLLLMLSGIDISAAAYACTSDSDCQYCNDPNYPPAECHRLSHPLKCSLSLNEDGTGVVDCFDPPSGWNDPCAVGQFSVSGKNQGGSRACQPCPRGWTTVGTESTTCDVWTDPTVIPTCRAGSVWIPEDGKCVNACTHAAVRALMKEDVSNALNEASFYFNHSTTYGCRYLWGPSYFATRGSADV